MTLVVKNPPTSAGDIRNVGSILQSGRSPGGGNGNPLPYSCRENPTDNRTWQSTVHGVVKESDTTKHTHQVQCRLRARPVQRSS